VNYYPRHIGDWRVATWNLTKVQRCIYSDLIDSYYDKEQPLPSANIAEEMGCRTPDELAALAYVLSRYFKLDSDNLYHHDRCDDEIKHFRRVAEIASKAGKASASARAAIRAERKHNGGPTDDERSGNGRSTSVQPPKTEDRRENTNTDQLDNKCAPYSGFVQGSASPPPHPAPDSTAVSVVAEQKNRPSRKCPKGFLVTVEMQMWAAEKCPLLGRNDMVSETDKFRDHTFGRAISDWAGAWRNWLRKEQEFREKRRPPPRQGHTADRKAKGESFMAAVLGEENGISKPGAIDVESRVVRDGEGLPPEHGIR
jgi:uncharacterized protein YdaU (DUF1376 family)